MKKHLFALFVFLALPLIGCSSIEITKHELAAFPDMPEDATPAPVGFTRIQYDIPPGTTVGASSARLLKEWPFSCTGPYGLIQTGIFTRSFPAADQKRSFNNVLRTQGYDVTGDIDRIFDSYEDESRALYLVGGRITNLTLDLCAQSAAFSTFHKGYSGEAEMTVEWIVRDALRRRNILKVETQGYARLHIANQDGIALLMDQAFSAAVHNLGAHQNFQDLIIFGIEPQDKPESYIDPYDRPINTSDATQEISINSQDLQIRTPTQQTSDALTDSVVLIETAKGHGSGFFISEDGYILTNAHVVGLSDQQRITVKGKKEKLISETVRLDRLRDVALLKLQTAPQKTKIKTLPIRTDKPSISEEVYAVGTPLFKRLQNSLTKGIVSAHRYNRREKQWYIQADVDIHPGNSGGPLLDDRGNIVGIAVASYTQDGKTTSGLNLFIPITDALERLNIKQNAHPKTQKNSVTEPPKSIINPKGSSQ